MNLNNPTPGPSLLRKEGKGEKTRVILVAIPYPGWRGEREVRARHAR